MSKTSAYVAPEVNPKRINPDGIYRYLVEAGDIDDYTVEKVARAFGVAVGTMRSLIKQHKLAERLEDEQMARKGITARLFTELYNQGLSDGQIAAEVDCDRTLIYQWRRRKNLPANIRPKKPKPAVINQNFEQAVQEMVESRPETAEKAPASEIADTWPLEPCEPPTAAQEPVAGLMGGELDQDEAAKAGRTSGKVGETSLEMPIDLSEARRKIKSFLAEHGDDKSFLDPHVQYLHGKIDGLTEALKIIAGR